MSHEKRLYLFILAFLFGQGAATGQDTLPATPRVLGKVLVLDSERCLEGDIEIVDDQYCVRQGMSEVWISGKKVLRVCPDWKAAYQFIQHRANLDDPDERLRIARWCQKNGMLPEALEEARKAQQMRPLHTETQHLVMVLKGSVSATRTSSGPVVRPTDPIDSMPAPDLIPEAVAVFATRVQPILLNTCVNCHSGGKGGAFQLYRNSDGGHRTALQRNLKSVVGQLRFDNPRLSPLLIKAISPHGATAASPLAGKASVPFQTLEGWVNGVAAHHPHLKEQALARRAAEEAALAKTAAASKPGFAEGTEASSPVVPEPMLPMSSSRPAAKTIEMPPTPTTPMTVPLVSTPEPKVSARPMPAPVEEPDAYSVSEFNRLVKPSP